MGRAIKAQRTRSPGPGQRRSQRVPPWQDPLSGSHFGIRSASITAHLPRPHPSKAAKDEPCALPPRKLTSIDKYATLSPSFSRRAPPFLGLVSWSKPDILETAVAQSRQEYLFLISICIASSLGEELGGGGEEMGLLVPAPRPGASPSSLPAPSLGSGSSPAFREAGAFGTWERSAQLEVAISNYPPISPACKMCFCVGCLPAGVLSVGSFRLFF